MPLRYLDGEKASEILQAFSYLKDEGKLELKQVNDWPKVTQLVSVRTGPESRPVNSVTSLE